MPSIRTAWYHAIQRRSLEAMSAGRGELPHVKIEPTVHSIFVRYIQWMLKRHFHAVRLSKDGVAPRVGVDTPLVVYFNHASWWDPLLALWLGARCFEGREQYGPIEAAQLKRYGFFRRLGFFGVEQGTVSGALAFLRTADALLARPGAMLWLTPQGRFADVRERPAGFAPGLGHLARRAKGAVFVPLAIEYGFGLERLPEVFVRFGAGVEADSLGKESDVASERLERALETCQDALCAEVCGRNPNAFRVMLQGAGGASLPYDLWRQFVARLRGDKVTLNHGQV